MSIYHNTLIHDIHIQCSPCHSTEISTFNCINVMDFQLLKLIAVAIFKFLFHLFDYVTDILMGMEWYNGYETQLEETKSCTQDTNQTLRTASWILFVFSTIGFFSGLYDDLKKQRKLIIQHTQKDKTEIASITTNISENEPSNNNDKFNNSNNIYDKKYFRKQATSKILEKKWQLVRIIIEDLFVVLLIVMVRLFQGVFNARTFTPPGLMTITTSISLFASLISLSSQIFYIFVWNTIYNNEKCDCSYIINVIKHGCGPWCGAVCCWLICIGVCLLIFFTIVPEYILMPTTLFCSVKIYDNHNGNNMFAIGQACDPFQVPPAITQEKFLEGTTTDQALQFSQKCTMEIGQGFDLDPGYDFESRIECTIKNGLSKIGSCQPFDSDLWIPYDTTINVSSCSQIPLREGGRGSYVTSTRFNMTLCIDRMKYGNA